MSRRALIETVVVSVIGGAIGYVIMQLIFGGCWPLR